MCEEYCDEELDDEKKYPSPLNPFDEKYMYTFESTDDDDDDDLF